MLFGLYHWDLAVLFGFLGVVLINITISITWLTIIHGMAVAHR